MRILVLSDSHRRTDRICEAIELQKGRIDALLFLGDGIGDIKFCRGKYPELPVCAVRGNCDEFLMSFLDGKNTPAEAMLNFDGYKLLIMHGHKFEVKAGIERAAAYAYEKGADILLFGHTHEPYEKYIPENSEINGVKTERPLYVFNPGSIALASGGIIELGKKGVMMGHFSTMR